MSIEIREWIVVDGAIVYATGDDAGPQNGIGAYSGFVGDYLAWLEVEHPDVWDGLVLIDTAPLPSYPAAESVPAAIKYVEEYVASLG